MGARALAMHSWHALWAHATLVNKRSGARAAGMWAEVCAHTSGGGGAIGPRHRPTLVDSGPNPGRSRAESGGSRANFDQIRGRTSADASANFDPDTATCWSTSTERAPNSAKHRPETCPNSRTPGRCRPMSDRSRPMDRTADFGPRCRPNSALQAPPTSAKFGPESPKFGPIAA